MSTVENVGNEVKTFLNETKIFEIFFIYFCSIEENIYVKHSRDIKARFQHPVYTLHIHNSKNYTY